MHLRCAWLSWTARLGAAVCWYGLLAAAGCSSGSSLGKIVPVQGKVTLADGKPLTNARLMLIPLEADPNARSIPFPRGRIKDDGSFTLYTQGKPGAPVGKYRVVVLPGPKKNALRNIPAQYLSQEKSPLELEVVEKEPEGGYNLKLLPRKRRR